MAEPESSLSLGATASVLFRAVASINDPSSSRPPDSRTSLKLFGLIAESAFTIIWNPVRWN